MHRRTKVERRCKLIDDPWSWPRWRESRARIRPTSCVPAFAQRAPRWRRNTLSGGLPGARPHLRAMPLCGLAGARRHLRASPSTRRAPARRAPAPRGQASTGGPPGGILGRGRRRCRMSPDDGCGACRAPRRGRSCPNVSPLGVLGSTMRCLTADRLTSLHTSARARIWLNHAVRALCPCAR